MDMPAAAITDHGVMYGAIDHYEACLKHGIRPVIGVEAYVAPRTHKDKDSQLDSQKHTRHLTLWAKNLQGYKNLVKLTTKANLHGFYYKPRVDHEMLAEHSEGIICGSACLGGEIPQLIIGQKFDEAVHRAEKYRDIFGKENFFLELMDHDLTGQDEVNQRVIDIHHRTGIPLVATNDAHYLTSKDERMHKVLVCIGTNSTLDKAALHYGPNFYLKSADEMWEKFKHVPEALENTVRIAEMCDVQLDLKTTHFPHYEVPPGHDLTSYFKHLCEERFPSRYPKGHPREAEARKRMAYEQQIIIDKGYSGYFLVVQDFINWSKSRGILVGCRGSAAGCLVSYVLGITNLDPLPYGLLFERFLNPERKSTPDIDVDFPDKRRDEVLKYVSDKYGKEKVAQIITFGTLAARAAVRDSARAMGLDLKLADNVSKMIPAIPGHAISIAKAIEEVKELGDLYDSDSQVKNLLDTAQQIEGFTRHASRHACGVVIGKEALDELVPLEEKDGDIITQYHAKAVEKVGLVKMDFLGLQNNTVINDTLELIESRHNEKIDLEAIELNDKRVYDMLGRGDGIAVFQMEGTGMRKLLRELKPENLEHIIAQISLYRPGPMDEIPRYIQGRFGGKVTYPHPKLEAVLKDTYGMLLYQEQVMQAATVLANFTGGQAESLMKAMSKKKADEMAAMKPLFLDGCKANKISQGDATDIFDRMEAFAKYAFNKCIFSLSTIRLPDGRKMRVAEAYKNPPAEIMAMWPDGEIRPHKVQRIVKTGRKPLLKIRTKKGRVIKATAEHRFLTTEGYLPVSVLCVGDELLTDACPATEVAAERLKPTVRLRGQDALQVLAEKNCVAIASVHAGGQLAEGLAAATSVAEKSAAISIADSARQHMAQWLIAQNIDFEMHKVLPNGRICDFYFAGTYWEMDGMDRVAEYFEAKYGDLPFVVVTPEDFKFRIEHHLQLAHAQNGDPIVSIEPCGEGMTYDIEMAPDGPLNFIANGIVSHNSHAAYYGLVSYWTAWLKTNYKPEFMACKMTSLLEKKDKLLVVIDDCRKNGLQVLAPDVNESNRDFTVVGARHEESIRFGLQAIKGIGEGPVAAICEARKDGGRFINIFDFCTRVAPRACGKGAIETLVKCGAFDSIHDNRQAALDAVDRAMLAAVAASKGQGDLFGAPSETGQIKSTGTLENVPDASRDERLAWEKELLGLYISDHPLLPLRAFLERRCTGLDKIGEEGLRDNARVEVGGLVTSVMKRFDKNSRPWAIFGLEDLAGSIEVLAFAKTYEKCGECVTEDARLIVRGRISADTRRGGFKQSDEEDAESDTVYKIMADEIELIPVEEVADYDDAQNAPQVLAAPMEAISNAEMPPQVLAAPQLPANGNGISLHRSNIDAPPTNGNGSYSNGHSNGNGHYANGNGATDYAPDAPSYAPEFASGTTAGNGEWGDAVESIGRFFSPPEWAAGCVHLHIGEDCATAETLGKLWNICKRYHGDTEVWLHVDNGLEMMQLRVAPDYWVEPSEELANELLGVLRAECLQVPY